MPNTINTAYEVQADTVESESGISIENGVFHVYDNKLKVHLNGAIQEVTLGSTTVNARKYGSFYSTVTQSPTISTVTAITLNGTDTSSTSGVSIVNSSKVKVDTVGVYNVQFSAQLYRVQGGTVKEAVIWLRKNGVNVPDTSTRVTMQSNSDFLVAAWNFFISLSANDYIELMIHQNDAIQLIAETENLTHGYPSLPSVILTVDKVG
jgi:hypothetical protein